MIHANKTMNNLTPVVGTIEVIAQGPTGVTTLVDGQRQFFPDLDALFRAAVHLLDKHRASGRHALQQELLPMRRSLP